MGAIISSVLGVISLVVLGVINSIAAAEAKNKGCSKARKYNIWSAVGSFAMAVILILILIFAI